MANLFKDTLQDLDQPIEWTESNIIKFIKKGKLRVIIHFEDSSYKEYAVKLNQAYNISIKKRVYIVLPECIIKGKYATIHYYFNNPWPIQFKHQVHKLDSSKLWAADELKLLPKEQQSLLADVRLDSETLQAAFNSNWLKAMYSKPGLTAKNIIIILGAVIVAILVVLQITGVVDVVGWFTGNGGG